MVGEARLKLPRLTPAQALVVGFALTIAVGTVILMLPQATASGEGADFTTALFTATSAVCVTGLIVVDTATYWSGFGQLIILLLIQIGGLGIMTMSTFVALLLGRRVTLRGRLFLQEALGESTLAGLVRLTRYVLLTTALIEGTGALLLTLRWAQEFPLAKAAYFGLFHSVSAFNNAGFDLFSISLASYTTDFVTNVVITTLFIVGGLGFAVLLDVYFNFFLRGNGNHVGKSRLTLHTRLVLRLTLALLVFGTVFIFLVEASNPATLRPLGLTDRLLASFFQAATPRTAGFNTLPIAEMQAPTLLLLMIFMFIGASPGSTGGGIKTTTFGSLVLAVWATVTGRHDIVVNEKRLARDIVERALAITMISLGLIFTSTMVLLITEKGRFLPILFESMSAFGTVGLSMGVTQNLSVAGRVVVILTMFIGRVGPLTMAEALARRRRKGELRYPEERITVG